MNPAFAVEQTGSEWESLAAALSAAKARTKTAAWSRAAFVCAAALVATGLLVLLGWALGNEHLTSVLQGRASMKPNTALAVLCSGVALMIRLSPALGLSRSPGARTVGFGTSVFALLVLTAGVGTLLEYLLHVDLGIDQFLFADHQQLLWPGRMAFITAINFTLVGLALLGLQGGARLRVFARTLTLCVLLVAYAAVVGYLYGVPLLYGGAAELGSISMAVHTGAAFVVISLVMLVAEPDSELLRVLTLNEAGSTLLRGLLPILVIVPVLVGWVYLQVALRFGGARFGMALLAVTLVAVGTAAVWVMTNILNNAERERRAGAELRAVSAAAVERSERELRLVTDHLPALLSYIDRGGHLLRVNRTYESWHGRPVEQIVGRSLADLLGSAYWEATRSVREQAFAGQTVTFEANYPAANGPRQAMITYSPDLDADGTVRGLACMVLDVDEQRKAEAALRQSEKLAVVGRLASSIAHEINNPLEAVTNLLYLAEQETHTLPLAAEYVADAQRELNRVTQIVTQTLRFHRQSTQAKACHFSDLLEQVLVLYHGRLAGAGIVVQRDFVADPPVICREGEIRQVMANLLGNALDAMPRGGRICLRVRACGHPRTGRPGAVFIVGDTGHGIPPQVRRRLYEPFQTTKGEKGSGLGLWVSKEIIERHQGLLQVHSSYRAGASGTVFRIWLPA